MPHTTPITIRFTDRERRTIERQQRKAETFGDTVRRMLFAAYPSLKDRAYTKRLLTPERTEK
jgi:hypothetical protein